MELMIPLKTKSDIPMYEQIYLYIKEEIKAGNIPAGAKLPSTRVLADNLKVSRSTTQMAYEQLLSEGYIEAVPCRGYFAAEVEELVGINLNNDSGSFVITVEKEQEYEYKIDFSPRGIDLESFPFNTWRKISRSILTTDNKKMFLNGHAQGEESLREAIAEYLHSARGVNCKKEQIIVGAGNEYLLMLLSQIVGSGKTIAMENPTYKQAYLIFNGLGYNVMPADMDASGMMIDELKKSMADIAYVMPSHQYPMGIVMPVKRRQELLTWAYKEAERYIIEDDHDSEFRYKGKPIPALQGMDSRDRVIYIGTFSRSIAPAIRVSFLVLPLTLMKRYKEYAGFYSSTVSRIDQNILYQFLTEGYYERHLNHMRAVYKAKHDVLMNALRELEKQFIIKGEYAGTHLLLEARNEVPEERLVILAKKAQICVYGLSEYFIKNVQNKYPATILLGYANLTENEILEGIKNLKEAWRDC